MITLAAARHLISSRNPDMSIEVATQILEDSAESAILMNERTETGELYYSVPDLGGRLIVKDTDPDIEFVVVAFVRDRKPRGAVVNQGEVALAREIIRASVAEGRKNGR